MRFKRVDEWHARSECGRFTICRIWLKSGWIFECWDGNRCIGRVPVVESKEEAWKQAVKICEQ